MIGILGTYIYTNIIILDKNTINNTTNIISNNTTNNTTNSVIHNGSTNTVTQHQSTTKTKNSQKSDLQKQYDSGNIQSVTQDDSVEGPPITIVEYNDGSEGEYDNQGNYIGDQ